MESLQGTDMVNQIWEVQLLRYHQGALYNPKRLGLTLTNILRGPLQWELCSFCCGIL